jgi:hypothetical protein
MPTAESAPSARLTHQRPLRPTYTSSRGCPANRTLPLPARNARVCSGLPASESSIPTIDTQHSEFPFRLILHENPSPGRNKSQSPATWE